MALEASRKIQAHRAAFAIAIGLNEWGKQQAAWLMLLNTCGSDSQQCARNDIVGVVPMQVNP